MWIVIKIKPNNLKFVKDNLSNIYGKYINFYNPKIKYEKITKNKKKVYIKNIINGYILCHSEKFEKQPELKKINLTQGVKYVLKGCKENQNDITKFVDICKSNEGKDGFLTQGFFDIVGKTYAKFLNGPFSEIVFKILSDQKNKVRVMIGNTTATIRKNNKLLYCSI